MKWKAISSELRTSLFKWPPCRSETLRSQLISPCVLQSRKRSASPSWRAPYPKGLNAPNERDLVYLTRADLLVVLWNGSSEGTHKLIAWYQAQQKDIVIGFV